MWDAFTIVDVVYLNHSGSLVLYHLRLLYKLGKCAFILCSQKHGRRCILVSEFIGRKKGNTVKYLVQSLFQESLCIGVGFQTVQVVTVHVHQENHLWSSGIFIIMHACENFTLHYIYMFTKRTIYDLLEYSSSCMHVKTLHYITFTCEYFTYRDIS